MRQSTLLTAALVVCAACTPDTTTANFNEREWALLSTLELTETLPVDPFNPLTDNQLPQVEASAVALGQALFFDRGLAGGDGGVRFGQALPGGAGVSCADCHSPQAWFSDGRTPREVSVGLGLTKRNSPGLVDVSNYRVFSWDGRGETLPNQCIIAYVNSRTMAGTALQLCRRLLEVPEYRDAYDRLFPDQQLPTAPDLAPPDELARVLRNTSFVWAAYLRQLQSHDAAFDRFVRGDPLALTSAQQRGLKLFIGNAGCIECHSGPMFSDSLMHVSGVGQTSPGAPMVDLGHAEALTFLATFPFALGTPPPVTPADLGAFRTKSLRHVTETGPYFHAGQYASLRDVIWFYVRGGDHAGAGTESVFLQPLGLTDDEQADLEAFLHSLTGLPPDDSLRCDRSQPTRALQVDGGIGPRPRTFPLCTGITP